MNAEIICIGNELLSGRLINTNASYFAGKLAETGISCKYQVTVCDDVTEIVDTIKRALWRADLVITTGGLGPTVDDLTLSAISKAADRKLILHPEILKRIRAHFTSRKSRIPNEVIQRRNSSGSRSKTRPVAAFGMAKETPQPLRHLPDGVPRSANTRQAYLPKGAKEIKNKLGTAPGFILTLNKKELVAFPGPPVELKPMMEGIVLPYLRKKYGKQVILTKKISTTGLCEADVNAKVKDILCISGDTTVGIYVHPAQVDLVITAKAKTKAQGQKRIKKITGQIRKNLGDIIFSESSETLEEVIGKALFKKHKTLSTAESATGGLISDKITNAPGSSKYFMLGITAYSNEAKTRELGVPPEIIKKYGAVSEPVAKFMAQGIRYISNTDYALSTTGICGPTGATKQKPIGTFYIALAKKGSRTICRKFLFSGTRRIIKIRACLAALDLLRKEL
ncbi:MAG: competence/damage-inducible protein A [Candidatus Omnitrophota bacterium]